MLLADASLQNKRLQTQTYTFNEPKGGFKVIINHTNEFKI